MAESVQNAFSANKINCESLGNSCAHLHWHIIPRYNNDPSPDKAIWSIDRNIIESVSLSDKDINEMNLLLKKRNRIYSYKI